MDEPHGAGPAVPPLLVWGVDHHLSRVELRERLAVPAADPLALAGHLRQLPGACECVVVSTCNRLEIYLGGSVERERLEAAMAEQAGVPTAALAGQAFAHTGEYAARHLFRVVSGLESMVLGEAEIAGQVRRAYDAARAVGLVGAVLNPLFQRALACGKDVRNNTGLGDHKLSVASQAVDLVRQVHDDLGVVRLLIVGAGETSELAARYLVSAGVRTITVVNRNPERAADLAARISGTTLPWSGLGEALIAHDVVVSSTAAPHPVITAAMVQQAVNRRRAPLVIVDLAVPRDVEPSAAAIDDAFVFNIDHIERVIAHNLGQRREEVAAAESLVASAVIEWRRSADADGADLLARIASHVRDLVAAEEARLAAKLPQADRAQLRYGLERVGNKLLHPVLAWLRQHADDPEARRKVSELLGLERER